MKRAIARRPSLHGARWCSERASLRLSPLPCEREIPVPPTALPAFGGRARVRVTFVYLRCVMSCTVLLQLCAARAGVWLSLSPVGCRS